MGEKSRRKESMNMREGKRKKQKERRKSGRK